MRWHIPIVDSDRLFKLASAVERLSVKSKRVVFFNAFINLVNSGCDDRDDRLVIQIFMLRGVIYSLRGGRCGH